MFDSFFSGQQKFAYDVGNTVSRAANMLLQRGIKVEPGETACTDGEDTIYLPQTMRKWLSWDEIDFVRYLLHHEAAHIKHSNPKDAKFGNDLERVIYNSLEDIRIEAIDLSSMAGSKFIYDRGRKIMVDMWGKVSAGFGADNPASLSQAVINSIYAGHLDPSFRESAGDATIDLVNETLRSNGLFDAIDKIDKHTHPNTILTMTRQIRELLLGGMENFVGNDCGTPQEQGEMQANIDAASVCPSGHSFGSGMQESLCETLDADKDEESANFQDSSKGFSLGTRARFRRAPLGSRQNFEWGKHAAASAGNVINLLRGQSRADWSRPRDSGLRIHQRSVPDFIQGLTNNVLRQRKVTPKRGTSVFIMIDDSSSMAGEFDVSAWRTASMLGHACERAQMRMMIGRYSDNVYIDKYWHTPLSSMQDRCGLMLGGSTNAVTALATAKFYLDMEKNPRRVLFFLSDGATGDGQRPVIKGMVSEGIEVYPILLGEYASSLGTKGNYWDYPTTAMVPRPSKALASTVLGQLASVIQ